MADERKLDGNAAAGILRAIFPYEMTTVETICDGCGAHGDVGALAAYMHGMGAVLRCPGCDTVLIRVAHIKGRYWLDMRGVRSLHIAPDR
jgi:Family of unknown function (DUF6510)